MLTTIARHLNIHDADVNWFEGTQLMVSTIVVPAFARLGDMVGHRRLLAISAGITAAATLGLCLATSFWMFLLCWAVQGFYTVWLPLEIALVYGRARRRPQAAGLTRQASGILVAALEIGVIVGALAGGVLGDAWAGRLWAVLLVPGIIVAICFAVVCFGIRDLGEPAGGRLDVPGLALITAALLALAGGLSLMRILGPESVPPWAAIAAGIVLLWPFARHELRQDEPLIDVRMLGRPDMWPVQLTAGLFGVSVLGAQAPLSTFARTDAAVHGYGLSASSSQVSLLIGVYVLTMLVGALLFPVITRVLAPRLTLIVAAVLVAVGYGLFLVSRGSLGAVLTNMAIAGVGSGALVAALPAAAAAAAPVGQTGVATGLTNTTKTLGGAVASCVFGVALLRGASGTAGSLAGYLTVWGLCGATALVAAVCLLFVPRDAFGRGV